MKRIMISLLAILLIASSFAFSESSNTNSMIYYLYLPSCEDCAKADALLGELPESVTITRNGETFLSVIHIEYIDITGDTERVYGLFEKFSVPGNMQLAPLVLAGNSYYQGVNAIARFIQSDLPAGHAVGTDTSAASSKLPILKWASIFAAGLVGGLNPCALSMLLLFLSIVLSAPDGSGKAITAYLVSKFAVYLLIGTVFLNLFQLWNPTWLPMLTKLLLTAVSLFLIALNLRDAWTAKKEQYGEVKNQLPAAMRKGLQARIRKTLTHPGRKLIPVAAGLGAMVAAGEFLCSGQVYLATLLASIQKGERIAMLYGMLLAYCAAFLAPSAILSFVIERGRAVFQVSEGLRAKMPLIKVLTAAFFIVLLVVVWAL